jgi:spore coat polysaccharide biosynthesis protein SpsF (cytidylyltransferase family)
MVIRAAKAFSLSVLLSALLGVLGCSSVSVVRVQSDNVYVGPNLRPVAVIHAQAATAYVLFLPIPGGVDLDRVVNRMLIIAAKTLGADKVANLQVDITPETGVWTLRKLLGWRSAQASGVAVVVDEPADAGASEGPEPRPASGEAPGTTPPGTPPARP